MRPYPLLLALAALPGATLQPVPSLHFAPDRVAFTPRNCRKYRHRPKDHGAAQFAARRRRAKAARKARKRNR